MRGCLRIRRFHIFCVVVLLINAFIVFLIYRRFIEGRDKRAGFPRIVNGVADFDLEGTLGGTTAHSGSDVYNCGAREGWKPPRRLKMTWKKNNTAEERTHRSVNRYISGFIIGRLGNSMFTFAALLGVASYHGFTPLIHVTNPLLEFFDMPHISRLSVSRPKPFKENTCCAYDSRVENLDTSFNWSLHGYFQSWRYFRHNQDEVRASFKFRSAIIAEVTQYLRQARIENCTLVGVHVRRGDLADESKLLHGYAIASAQYFNASMNYFRHKYRNPVFVICTDDKSWVGDNLKGDDIFLSPFNKPATDMALLAHCDHVIVSSGTFGWWGAWLAGGDVVFFNGFPGRRSWLGNFFDKEDYYPPTWIGMN